MKFDSQYVAIRLLDFLVMVCLSVVAALVIEGDQTPYETIIRGTLWGTAIWMTFMLLWGWRKP